MSVHEGRRLHIRAAGVGLTSSYVDAVLDDGGDAVSMFLASLRSVISAKRDECEFQGYFNVHPKLHDLFIKFLTALHIRLVFQARPHEYKFMSLLGHVHGMQALHFRPSLRGDGGSSQSWASLRLWNTKFYAGKPGGIERDLDYHSLRFLVVLLRVFGMPTECEFVSANVHAGMELELASGGLVSVAACRVMGCHIWDDMKSIIIGKSSIGDRLGDYVGASAMGHSVGTHAGTHYLQRDDERADALIDSLQLAGRIRYDFS